mgnify:CR=1 FL=1
MYTRPQDVRRPKCDFGQIEFFALLGIRWSDPLQRVSDYLGFSGRKYKNINRPYFKGPFITRKAYIHEPHVGSPTRATTPDMDECVHLAVPHWGADDDELVDTVSDTNALPSSAPLTDGHGDN